MEHLLERLVAALLDDRIREADALVADAHPGPATGLATSPAALSQNEHRGSSLSCAGVPIAITPLPGQGVPDALYLPAQPAPVRSAVTTTVV
jgi:hypothetical protein